MFAWNHRSHRSLGASLIFKWRLLTLTVLIQHEKVHPRWPLCDGSDTFAHAGQSAANHCGKCCVATDCPSKWKSEGCPDWMIIVCCINKNISNLQEPHKLFWNCCLLGDVFCFPLNHHIDFNRITVLCHVVNMPQSQDDETKKAQITLPPINGALPAQSPKQDGSPGNKRIQRYKDIQIYRYTQ